MRPQQQTHAPEWWLRLYRQITARDFTGSVTLHCKEGQVMRVEEHRVSEPRELELRHELV